MSYGIKCTVLKPLLGRNGRRSREFFNRPGPKGKADFPTRLFFLVAAVQVFFH